MSYNQGGYGQQGQQGYGQQYNAYGQTGNDYQQNQAYGHTGNYSERPDLHHQSSSRYDEESAQGSNYEMSNMNGNDPNRLLNQVRNLDQAINQLEGEMQSLKKVQQTYLDSPDENEQLRNQVRGMSEDIMQKLTAMVRRVQGLKNDADAPNPRNAAQLGKIERRVRATLHQYQQDDSESRQRIKQSMIRRYRIVRPDASEAEVQEAAESGEQQVFSQALISSNRRGEAQSTARYVKNRHEDIQRIERQMAELAQLFNELDTMIVQQEPAVQQIEAKGEEATGHVAQANTQLDEAVKKARSARRKKWYCLGIAVLIIIIIVVVVVVVVEVTKK